MENALAASLDFIWFTTQTGLQAVIDVRLLALPVQTKASKTALSAQ
jgi:hypothetical protein